MRKNDVSLRNEHEGLRNRVGFYDFTHELLEVTGTGSGDFLDKMFVNAIGNTRIGAGKYTTMLNEQGIIIDDIIVFRMEKEKYWVSTLYIAEMIKWFDTYSGEFNVAYKDITSDTTMYAIQGPKSKEVLNDFLSENIDNLRDFNIRENKIDDIPVWVARSGFTGELGYELYFAPPYKELVESKLNESGKDFDIVEMKTDVILTSLPTEKGYVLMRDLAGINPLEAGFGWSIDWSKDFIGKAALEKAKTEGIKRKLIGFTVDDDAAEVEPDSVIKVNGKTAGKVTNFTYGFTVEKNIGYALIDQTLAKIGDQVTIESGDKEVEATLTKREFYDQENNRRKGITEDISM